jgi:predicted ester cyclase
MSGNQVEKNKATVRLLVDRVINEWHIDEIGSVFTREAALRARDDFTSFRRAFPDWQMDLQELVAEGDTVVARFKCRGTHEGEWRGDQPTGKTMAVDEVFFFRFHHGLIAEMWAIEDSWARKSQLGLR